MNEITINNYPMNIKEYNSQRVVTFKDIDAVHQRPSGTAKRNFRANREHFIENEDYFVVKPSDFQMDEIRPSEVNNRGTILLTESGYLMLVKSFTDDLAWSVQRQLVNCYFKLRELNSRKVFTELLQRQSELEKRLEALENNKKLLVQDMQNPVHTFIKECCIMRVSYRDGITTSKLYRAFEMWCRYNTPYAPSKSDFIAGILSYYNTNNKKCIKKKCNGYYYYIITLNPRSIRKLL